MCPNFGSRTLASREAGHRVPARPSPTKPSPQAHAHQPVVLRRAHASECACKCRRRCSQQKWVHQSTAERGCRGRGTHLGGAVRDWPAVVTRAERPSTLGDVAVVPRQRLLGLLHHLHRRRHDVTCRLRTTATRSYDTHVHRYKAQQSSCSHSSSSATAAARVATMHAQAPPQTRFARLCRSCRDHGCGADRHQPPQALL